jgi:type I restriction enzyme S subunit
MSKSTGPSPNGTLVAAGASWIAPDSLEERINADFYAPEYLDLERSLHGSPHGCTRLGSLVMRPFKGAFYVLASEYASEGVPFLRVGDITKGYVDLDKCTYLPRTIHEREKKTAVRPGCLLFAKGGSIGNCAVVPDWLLEANISQDLIGAVPKAGLDPYYANALLIGRYGVPQMMRWIQRATHPHLSNESICNVLVPDTDSSVQLAIGHKVRAAERLRAAASDSQAAITHWLTDTLPTWDEPGEQLDVSAAFTRDLNTERLDPWYNHTRFQQLELALAALPELIPLSSVGSLVTERWTCTTGEIEYIEIGEFDLAQGTAHGKVIAASNAPSRAQIAARAGDLAVSLVRPNRKNVVFIQGSGRRPIVVTSGCEVIRFRDSDTAALYSVVLRHNAITHQIMRWNTGTSYPAIERLRADRILVPAIPSDREVEFLNAARLAVTGVERAKELTVQAVADVENLIDGSLDEERCLAEGRALAEEFGLEVP